MSAEMTALGRYMDEFGVSTGWLAAEVGVSASTVSRCSEIFATDSTITRPT